MSALHCSSVEGLSAHAASLSGGPRAVSMPAGQAREGRPALRAVHSPSLRNEVQAFLGGWVLGRVGAYTFKVMCARTQVAMAEGGNGAFHSVNFRSRGVRHMVVLRVFRCIFRFAKVMYMLKKSEKRKGNTHTHTQTRQRCILCCNQICVFRIESF